MSNHIFQTYYNLCRLNRSRQEEAAQAGIIPSLKRVIETSSPLKQFALPILCDLASAGKSCRTLLWQYDGLEMYLKLLDDPYFQVSALESVLSWLQDETSRVEDELLKPESVNALLHCFVTAKANSFENLLDPFLKLTKLSGALTTALTRRPAFFERLTERLTHSDKAVVRLNVLRIIRVACEAVGGGSVAAKYGVAEIVERVSRDDGAVLVRELAREMGPGLKPGLAPPPIVVASGEGRKSAGKVVAPKKAKRASSETAVNEGPKIGSGLSLKAKTTGRIQGNDDGARSNGPLIRRTR
jgi:hypothetical protein